MTGFWRRLWASRRIEVKSIFAADRRRDKLNRALKPGPAPTSHVKTVEQDPYPPRRHVHTI